MNVTRIVSFLTYIDRSNWIGIDIHGHVHRRGVFA